MSEVLVQLEKKSGGGEFKVPNLVGLTDGASTRTTLNNLDTGNSGATNNSTASVDGYSVIRSSSTGYLTNFKSPYDGYALAYFDSINYVGERFVKIPVVANVTNGSQFGRFMLFYKS